jgi:hypothetical protein
MIRICEVGKKYLLINFSKASSKRGVPIILTCKEDLNQHYEFEGGYRIRKDSEKSNWEILPLTPLMEALY